MIQAFQTKILTRALGEKAVKEIFEQYVEARFRTLRNTPPNSKQIRLAQLAKKEGGITIAAKKAGVDPKIVHYALNRVGRWEYLNSK